jgi:hypothetical protein
MRSTTSAHRKAENLNLLIFSALRKIGGMIPSGRISDAACKQMFCVVIYLIIYVLFSGARTVQAECNQANLNAEAPPVLAHFRMQSYELFLIYGVFIALKKQNGGRFFAPQCDLP